MSIVSQNSDSTSGELPIFLTSFDPSDLPGNSFDPIGFERGYLLLADTILPGLSNVAGRPRYFSMLCAGIELAEVSSLSTPRSQYTKRLDTILRLERFWTLANALATLENTDVALSLSGIRGITYARRKAESLLRSGAKSTSASFPLLSRQIPYGVVGIYGAVSDGMRMIDRKSLATTPDLGQKLGEAFLDETSAPVQLKKAVRDDAEMSVARLTEWGLRAHVSAPTGRVESQCLYEALHNHPVRSRMAIQLESHPFIAADETELDRFRRMLPSLPGADGDLHEAISIILAYENAYRLVSLAFERLLWRCRIAASASLTIAEAVDDPVLRQVASELPGAMASLSHALDSSTSDLVRSDLHRLEDNRRFLERTSAACHSAEGLVGEVVDRHTEIQRGKFDKGRRKLPWLERIGQRISRTMTRVGGLDREVDSPDLIPAHPYRLPAADALIEAASLK